MKKHVAILGGAFNPITKGHIETACFIKERLKWLDELWLMPAYTHTFNKNMISPKHRLNICKLAINKKYTHSHCFKIFDYEIKNKIAGGTLHLYNILKNDKKYKDYEFFWIIGMDNANIIDKWVNYRELIKIVKFIVVPRYGVERNLSKNWYCKYPHIFLESYHYLFEVSSTKVRTLLTDYYKTKSFDILIELRNYIEIPVLNYILKNKLYEKTN